ncbi:MAG: biopolymer transporter ExbD [Bdellovibrionales bacterium]|nr:biopolymer transporter ExbD [Bdellovibrionales bacterium]
MTFSRTRKNRTAIEISMIPLVDLFLNILVFFLVSTSFNQESAFFVELPKAESAQGVAEAKSIFISMGSNNLITVNQQRVTLENLSSVLSEVSQSKRKLLPVVLRADKNIAHGKVVEVLDLVRQSGFENVGMATMTNAR